MWNRKVGGISLALIIVIAYCGFKFARLKWIDDVFSWYSFLWYVIWFFAIVINALISDLFEHSDSWIFNSLQSIEQKDIPAEEKVVLIRTQLKIAVERYMSVFLLVNNIEGLMAKILANLKRITKGKITVKELIVICAYAIYDLVLRGGELSMIAPWDVALVFVSLVILKVIDASSGFALLIAEMYKEAFNENKTAKEVLDTIADYIKHLAHLFDIESTEAQFTQLTPAEAVESAITTINRNVPLLASKNDETIRRELAKRILVV